MSSGFIDAVVYTLHGHVFAYAMTGNLVLLGVALSTHHPSDIVRHLLPLVSFAAGVVLGKALLRFRPAVSLHVTLCCNCSSLDCLARSPTGSRLSFW